MPSRGTTKQRGYDHRWRLLSEAMVRAQPLCTVCGRRDDLTCDHIIPLARGGRSVASNVRVVCRSCNRRKQDRADVALPPRPPLALVVSNSKAFECL
jgi:5-methylcytosine-specific restriction endonuclease McrA